MTALQELREKMKDFYAKYDIYVLPLFKFALALLMIGNLNQLLGYLTVLDNLFVITVLALLCAILPINGMAAVGVLLIILHCFGAGIAVGGFALILYLLMLLLYFRFVPGDGLVLVLAPLAFYFRIPAVVPLALGLLRGPLSAVSCVFSVISWYFVRLVPKLVESRGFSSLSQSDVLQELSSGLLENPELLTAIIACGATVLVAAAIRKLCATYAWEIAVVVGSLTYLLLTFLGGIFTGAEVEAAILLVGTAGAAVISLILEFFLYSVDYAGSQYLQFEDDQYYYYVKAIPKRLSPQAKERLRRAEEDSEPDPGQEMPGNPPAPAYREMPQNQNTQAYGEMPQNPNTQAYGEMPQNQNTQAYGEMSQNQNTQAYGEMPRIQNTQIYRGMEEIPSAPDLPEDAAERFGNVDFESKLEESLKNL